MRLSKFITSFALSVLLLVLCNLAQGQVVGKITFKEGAGQGLLLRQVVMLPAHDSMQGVYAGALAPTLQELLAADHRRDLVEGSFSTVKPAADWSKEPDLLKKIFAESGAQGALALGVLRRGGQLTLGLYLYHFSDNKLLLKQETEAPLESTHQQLREQLPGLYRALWAQLPYDSEILSRTQDQITLSAGARDGVKVGDRFMAVQILKLARHPHFEFLMETEQEALGSVQVTKVAEHMSFGKVISEISPQTLASGTKLIQSQLEAPPASIALSPRDDVAFGAHPTEWKPEPLPSFGLVRAGLGVYRSRTKTNLATAGSQDTGSTLTPAVSIGADAWMTARWTLSLNMEQSVSYFSNPQSASTPEDLSATLSRYNASFLRRVFPSLHYKDPILELGLGYSKWRWSVDSTTPLVFTNWDLSGWFVQMRGQVPLEIAPKWYLGGDFKIHLWPSLTESPETSASDSKNSLTEIAVFARYAMTHSWWLEAGLDLALYSGRLSGTGSTTDPSKGLSHNLGGFKASILYLF